MEERTIIFWFENRMYIQKLKLNAQNMAEFHQFVGFPPNPFDDHRWFMITSDPLLLATHQRDLVFGPFVLSYDSYHVYLDLNFSKLSPTEELNSTPSNVFHLEKLLLVEPTRKKRAEETEESFDRRMCGDNDFIILKKHDSKPIYLVETQNDVKPFVEIHEDKIFYPVMTIVPKSVYELCLTLDWKPPKRPLFNLSPLNVTGVLPMMKNVNLGVIASLRFANKRVQCREKILITSDEDFPINLKSRFDEFGRIAKWVNVTKDRRNWVEVTYETSKAVYDVITKSKANNGIRYGRKQYAKKVCCLEDCGHRAEMQKRETLEIEDDATAPKRARSSSNETQDPRAQIKEERLTPDLQ